jgi:dihydroorotase
MKYGLLLRSYEHPGGLGCSITPQHLLFNRNALFVKGLNPHFFCLPILKKEAHRQALIDAATSGESGAGVTGAGGRCSEPKMK